MTQHVMDVSKKKGFIGKRSFQSVLKATGMIATMACARNHDDLWREAYITIERQPDHRVKPPYRRSGRVLLFAVLGVHSHGTGNVG